MPPIPASRRFEILCGALALAEERHAVALADAARHVGVSTDQLRELLEPVLYLEFRTADGELVDAARAFLLGEDDVLSVDEGNWLRDLASDPPNASVALRLLVAASVYQATTARVWRPLDTAIAKLRQYVAVELVLPVDHPQCLDTALEANRTGRTLRFRYLKWKDEQATDREVLPYRVYSNWGHWYVRGPEVGDTELKQFRVDRMAEARMGDGVFVAPGDDALPDWFDLSAHERTVTVSVPRAVLEALPRPHTIDDVQDETRDRVRATVRVAGERQLDHLLVGLGPDGSVVAPAEFEVRRRKHARRLLELYS